MLVFELNPCGFGGVGPSIGGLDDELVDSDGSDELVGGVELDGVEDDEDDGSSGSSSFLQLIINEEIIKSTKISAKILFKFLYLLIKFPICNISP